MLKLKLIHGAPKSYEYRVSTFFAAKNKQTKKKKNKVPFVYPRCLLMAVQSNCGCRSLHRRRLHGRHRWSTLFVCRSSQPVFTRSLWPVNPVPSVDSFEGQHGRSVQFCLWIRVGMMFIWPHSGRIHGQQDWSIQFRLWTLYKDNMAV